MFKDQVRFNIGKGFTAAFVAMEKQPASQKTHDQGVTSTSQLTALSHRHRLTFKGSLQEKCQEKHLL